MSELPIPAEQVAIQKEAAALVQYFQIQHKAVDETVLAEIAGSTFFKELKMLRDFEAKCLSIEVTSSDQDNAIENCKAVLPYVVKLRTGSDAKKKKEKEAALRLGNALDAINNAIDGRCKKMEEHLKFQASFVERMEQAEYRRIGEERAKMLAPYGEALPVFEELGKMSDAMFDTFSAEVMRTAEIKVLGARALKAQQEAEAEKIRLEAEAVKAERERIQAELKAAQAENARLQALADAKAQAEKDALAKVQAEKDALAKAGTGAKMHDLANKVAAFEVPIIEGEEKATQWLANIHARFVAYVNETYK